MPPSVTERAHHSVSTIAVSRNCAWLMVIGNVYGQEAFVLSEIIEWHNETKTSTECMLMTHFFEWLLYSLLLTHTHTHTHAQMYTYMQALT